VPGHRCRPVCPSPARTARATPRRPTRGVSAVEFAVNSMTNGNLASRQHPPLPAELAVNGKLDARARPEAPFRSDLQPPGPRSVPLGRRPSPGITSWVLAREDHDRQLRREGEYRPAPAPPVSTVGGVAKRSSRPRSEIKTRRPSPEITSWVLAREDHDRQLRREGEYRPGPAPPVSTGWRTGQAQQSSAERDQNPEAEPRNHVMGLGTVRSRSARET